MGGASSWEEFEKYDWVHSEVVSIKDFENLRPLEIMLLGMMREDKLKGAKLLEIGCGYGRATLRYAQEGKLTAVQMAAMLGITKADMSRIFNHRIERFSTDKLIRLYAQIRPDYRLEVA